MHKDVSLIIFYKDDKILLQDRRNIQGTYADWGFFGGKIMAGETPEQAVIRETKEELCYELKDFTLVRKSHHGFKDVRCTAFVFVAPCPPLSDFVQKEGQGMKLVTEDQALKFNMVTPDYDIIKYVFEFLRSSQNELSQKRL